MPPFSRIRAPGGAAASAANRFAGVSSEGALGRGARMANASTVRRLKIGAAVAVLALAALVADRLYQTDRQQIRAVANRLAAAIEECDEEAFLAELVEDYDDEGLRREDVERIASTFFHLYGSTWLRVRSARINVSKDVATADCKLYGLLFQHPLAWFYSEWRLGLVRVDGEWRIEQIAPLTLRGGEIEDFKSLAAKYGLLHRPEGETASLRRSRERRGERR